VKFAWLIVVPQLLRLVLQKAALRIVILFRKIHQSFPFFCKLVAGWGNLTKRRVGNSRLKTEAAGRSATRSIADALPTPVALQMNEYGINDRRSDHEEDHVIPLQFGGSMISAESLKRRQCKNMQ